MKKLPIEKQVDVVRTFGFERIASLLEHLSLRSSEDDLRDYLNTLLFDVRGTRSGFPEPVMRALFEIQEMVPPKTDAWGTSFLR